MNTMILFSRFFFQAAAVLTLAAGVLFSTGAAGALPEEAVMHIKATVQYAGSIYFGYQVNIDCGWNFSDVDTANNEVIGAQCEVTFIPPSVTAPVPIPYPINRAISYSPKIKFVNADGVLKLYFPKTTAKRIKSPAFTATVTMNLPGWRFADSTATAGGTATREDTRGLCLTLEGAEEECSIDRASSQECLIYDFVDNEVYQGTTS